MKISGLEFAFNNLDQRVHIDAAQKNTRWWLLEGKQIELVLCDGEKVKKYWRTKVDGEFEKMYPDGIKQYWNRESEQHKYIKRQLLEKKILPIGNNHLIRPHSVEAEVWLDSIKKRPDIVFYDKDGNIMCLIEIYYSNKKSPSDIKKLSELNVPIFEINVSNYEIKKPKNINNKATVNLIFNPERTNKYSEIKEDIKQTERGIKENKQIYKPQWREITQIEEEIEWTEEDIRGLEYEYKWLEGEIQSGGIQRIEEYTKAIGRVRNDIASEERKQIEIDSAIRDAQQRIREIESSIKREEVQRQLERHSMWVKIGKEINKQNPLF